MHLAQAHKQSPTRPKLEHTTALRLPTASMGALIETVEKRSDHTRLQASIAADILS
jgi:hypothetical protein